MSLLESFLRGIAAEPWAEHRWLVLCDWLEENDDPRRAELVRLHRRLLTTCCVPGEHAERATWQSRVVELLGQGVRPCVPRQTVALAEGVGMAFSFIPPGRFLMGSPVDEEERDNDKAGHQACAAGRLLLERSAAVLIRLPPESRARRHPGDSRLPRLHGPGLTAPVRGW
jgi:uncharacterized protein (TIGR02996 family)